VSTNAEQELFDPEAMFGGFEPPTEEEPSAPEPTGGGNGDGGDDEREYKDETLWMKYNVAGGVGRRCRVSRWMDAGRVIVDISEVDGSSNKLKGGTSAFLKVTPLATWLRAVATGQGRLIYPPIKGSGVSTPENFMVYGGGILKGQPVSRVFKAHHWPTSRDDKGVPTAFDEGAFMWRTVLYKAKQGDKGQFIPVDMGAPLSTHAIKMTRQEMAEVSYAVDMYQMNMAARLGPNDWLAHFISKRQD